MAVLLRRLLGRLRVRAEAFGHHREARAIGLVR